MLIVWSAAGAEGELQAEGSGGLDMPGLVAEGCPAGDATAEGVEFGNETKFSPTT